MRPSGIFLLASWRLGFTLFLWITTIFLLLLVVKCLKSLALALKNQGSTLLGPDTPLDTCTHQGYSRGHRSQRVRAVSNSSLQPSLHSLRGSRVAPSHLTLPPHSPSLPSEPPPYESVAEGPTEPPPTYSSLYPEPKAPTLSPV